MDSDVRVRHEDERRWVVVRSLHKSGVRDNSVIGRSAREQPIRQSKIGEQLYLGFDLPLSSCSPPPIGEGSRGATQRCAPGATGSPPGAPGLVR
jgi:hypothetical protein